MTVVFRNGVEQSSLGVFSSRLDIGVFGVDLLEEMMTVFCLLDNKGVIHKPESQVGGWGLWL